MNQETIIAQRPHKVIYRDGNTCVKAFDEAFSKADILNEALNHARIEQTGLAIPKLLGQRIRLPKRSTPIGVLLFGPR